MSKRLSRPVVLPVWTILLGECGHETHPRVVHFLSRAKEGPVGKAHLGSGMCLMHRLLL